MYPLEALCTAQKQNKACTNSTTKHKIQHRSAFVNPNDALRGNYICKFRLIKRFA